MTDWELAAINLEAVAHIAIANIAADREYGGKSDALEEARDIRELANSWYGRSDFVQRFAEIRDALDSAINTETQASRAEGAAQARD